MDENNEIIIYLDGGLVQTVISPTQIQVQIIDLDTDGQIEDTLVIDGDRCYTSEPQLVVDPDRVKRIKQEIRSKSSTPACPVCHNTGLKGTRGAYVQVGTYNESAESYEEEYDVTQYQCEKCGCAFYL